MKKLKWYLVMIKGKPETAREIRDFSQLRAREDFLKNAPLGVTIGL